MYNVVKTILDHLPNHHKWVVQTIPKWVVYDIVLTTFFIFWNFVAFISPPFLTTHLKTTYHNSNFDLLKLRHECTD